MVIFRKICIKTIKHYYRLLLISHNVEYFPYISTKKLKCTLIKTENVKFNATTKVYSVDIDRLTSGCSEDAKTVPSN